MRNVIITFFHTDLLPQDRTVLNSQPFPFWFLRLNHMIPGRLDRLLILRRGTSFESPRSLRFAGRHIGGQTAAGRLNQLQGQHGHKRATQQPEAIGSVATASRISIFFIFYVSSQSSRGITAWVASSEYPIQTYGAGINLSRPRVEQNAPLHFCHWPSHSD